MKKIFQIILLSAITTALFNTTEAQRTREFRQSPSRSESRVSSAPVRQSTYRSAPVRSFENRSPVRNEVRTSPSRTFNSPSRAMTERVTPERNYTVQRNTTVMNREVVTRNPGDRVVPVMRNNYSYSSNRNNYGYNRNYNSYTYRTHYYANIYGRTTYIMYGPRYRVIPHSFISIRFGGYPYYYNNGFYYGYYGGYYTPIFPPFGLAISVLPVGYSTIYMGPVPYYYYNGIYYRQYEDNYQVVQAPLGATVNSLPGGTKSVLINGETFYELNGTYYKPGVDSNGNTVFTVVGKNGVINTSNSEPEMVNPPVSLQMGDVINQLPDNSKIITLNGEQLYETPDNIYLKEENVNGQIQYKVVGK